MASIHIEKNGTTRILVVCPDGKRRSIRLGAKGQLTRSMAERAKQHIEHLVGCIASDTVPRKQTLEWINRTTVHVRARLPRAGLIEMPTELVGGDEPEVAKPVITLGEFLTSYFDGKESEIKDSTAVFYRHTKARLLEYFPAKTPLESIDAIKAREFQAWLGSSNRRDKAKKQLATATVRRRMGVCRQIFAAALDEGHITRNPFKGMKVSVRSNRERLAYIEAETIQQVMRHAPNARWRALIALCRFGGVRVPSEVAGLRWSHVSWESETITILSPKTEHHEGRESRIVPLFEALRVPLREYYDYEAPDCDLAFPDLTPQSNLRTQFEKIVKKSGVKQWPKLWQNLRASAATDFARNMDSVLAAAICGHTVEIQREFYRTIDRTDLARAKRSVDAAQIPAHSQAESAQITAQQTDPKQTKPTNLERETLANRWRDMVALGQDLQEKWAILDSNQ